MKRIYSFIITAFTLSHLFIDCKGQAYVPFPDSGAVWNVQNTTTDGTALDYFQGSYYFSGNTIIALGNTYKELNQNGILEVIPFMSGNPSWYNISGSSGYALRQDVVVHKVFVYNINAQQETIFIDFNLQIGDTLNSSKIIWGPVNGGSIISSLDSVLI